MSQTSSKLVVALIGKEGAGKSRLATSITGKVAYSSNFRGSTVNCETYDTHDIAFVDTPGIERTSDSQTTATALAQLHKHDVIVLVVQATQIDSDLEDLLPLVQGKRGIVVVTHWDRIKITERDVSLEKLRRSCALEFIPVDARRLGADEKKRIMAGVSSPSPFPEKLDILTGWRIEPHPTVLEHKYLGKVLALILIFIPSITAVFAANTFAGMVEHPVRSLLMSAAEAIQILPQPIAAILAGDYGFVTMGPLLFVWAVPTIVIYSVLLGAYKASGLLERISSAMQSLLRPLGLNGRDLVRIIMGFGCNVPAVLSTRSCSSCSRGTTISAIAFGSACSYQFGATIGVFAAAQQPWLVTPFLLFLAATTIIYTRAISSRAGRSRLNLLVTEGRVFIEFPSISAIWMESKATIFQFFRLAIPIFLAITLVASLLDWAGAIALLAGLIGPIMSLFGLPPESALAVIFGSIRKDGLLLLAEPGLAATLSPLQLLTGVYIAGVLLPCLVTLLTIVREKSWRFAAKMAGKQAVAAVLFSLALAWLGRVFMS